MSDTVHGPIRQNIQRLRMYAATDDLTRGRLLSETADRMEAWWIALQKIATGQGDGKTDAEVMRGIAEETLSATRPE